MTNLPKLSEGALDKMLNDEHVKQPVLQVLAHKSVPQPDGQARYRFLMSDGIYSHQCCIMMGPHISKVESGEFDRFSVIQLNKYILNIASGKKVLIMLEPQIIAKGFEVGKKIGNPIPWDTAVKREDGNANNVKPVTSNPSANQATRIPPSHSNPSKMSYSTSMDSSILSEDKICPISQITPYQNRWAIRGRVTNKSGIRSWSNVKGEGTLFSFTLQDESGDIKVTAFKNECDKFYEMVEVGKVYFLTKALVKIANKKFSDCNHDYELTLTSDSILERGNEHDDHCPQIDYKFVKIADLVTVPSNTTVDVIGVCRDVGELSTTMSRAQQRELRKRDISLVDDSEVEIKLTLWNEQATAFTGQEGSTVLLKKARVSEFNGKTLTTGLSTMVQVDPDTPIANGLKGWYNRRGTSLRPTKLTAAAAPGEVSEFHNLNYVTKESILTSPNQSMAATFNAFITQMGKASIYMACPDGCKKKLIEMNNGFYKCDKCNKETTQPEPRVILSFCISDCTGSLWVSAFHEEVERLLGIDAQQLANLKDQNQEEFEELISSLNFKSFNFRLRAKLDHFKEEMKIRSNIISINSINIISYCNKLIEQIKEMDS